MTIDTTKLTNVQVEDVKMFDYPDFCDAFISHAEIDGEPLTEEQLDYINENELDFVHEQAHESII